MIVGFTLCSYLTCMVKIVVSKNESLLIYIYISGIMFAKLLDDSHVTLKDLVLHQYLFEM